MFIMFSKFAFELIISLYICPPFSCPVCSLEGQEYADGEEMQKRCNEWWVAMVTKWKSDWFKIRTIINQWSQSPRLPIFLADNQFVLIYSVSSSPGSDVSMQAQFAYTLCFFAHASQCVRFRTAICQSGQKNIYIVLPSATDPKMWRRIKGGKKEKQKRWKKSVLWE